MTAAIKLGALHNAPSSVDPAKVIALCTPQPSCLLNSASEREQMALKTLARAHAANKEGATAKAAALFYEAAQLEPYRTSTLLSHLSMRFKLGEAELVVACYLWLLEHRELSEREWEHVRCKLREVSQRVVETEETRRAAVAIQRITRGRSASTAVLRRRHQNEAARVINLCWLRRARQRHDLGVAPLVTHVVLLCLPPAFVDYNGGTPFDEADGELARCTSRQPAIVLASYVLPNRSHLVSPEALAPFASMALPTSQPPHVGGVLNFVLTTRNGLALQGCALSFAEVQRLPQSAVAGALLPHSPSLSPSASTSPREVLVLLGQRYLPRALAACAHALLPLALPLANAAAADESLQVSLQSTEARCARLRAACRALLLQPAPRATGWPCVVECAGVRVTCIVPTFPAASTLAGVAVGAGAVAAVPPPMPPPVEPLYESIAPMGVDVLTTVLTALLLEQKVLLISARASRLSAAAYALSSLIFPLRWCNTFAPLLPPSHEAVTSMPFPYILGIVRSAQQARPTPAAHDGADMAPCWSPETAPSSPSEAVLVVGREVVRVFLDEGRVEGKELLPLPEREGVAFRARLRAALDGGGRAFGSSAASDAAVQAACLALTTSLLCDCPARLAVSRGARDDAYGSSAAEGLETQDEEVREITDAFIRKQPVLSRAFARKLSETASFKHFVEVLIQPSCAWPRWMHLFAAHARHEAKRRPT